MADTDNANSPSNQFTASVQSQARSLNHPMEIEIMRKKSALTVSEEGGLNQNNEWS